MEEGEGGGGGDDGGSTHPVRLFVGGLPSYITEEELLTRFTTFGSVKSIEIVPSKDVSETEANDREKIPCRGFAYIDFVPETDSSLQKCLSLYNGCKWKGGRMRVEKARENFMVRLQKEWAEAASEASADPPSTNAGSGEFTETDARDAASGKDAPSMLESQPPRLAPLNLVWSSWPFCKRTRVVPADGGRGCGRHKRSFERLEPIPLRSGVADGPPKRRPGAGRDWEEEERDWYGGAQEATEEQQRQQRRRVDDAQPEIGGIADMDVELDPEVVPSPVDVAEEEDDVTRETAAERTKQLALLASMFPEAEPAKAEGAARPGASVVRSHKLTSFVPVPRYDPANPNQTLIPSVVNPEHGDVRTHAKNPLPVPEAASLKGVKDGPVQHKGVVADNGFKVVSDRNGKVAKEGKVAAGLEGGAPAVKSKPMSPWERALAVAAGTLVEEEEEEDELEDEEEEGGDVAAEEMEDDAEEEMEEEDDQGGEEDEMEEDNGNEEREEMGGGEIGVEGIERVEDEEDEEEEGREVEEEEEDAGEEDAGEEEEDEVEYEDKESEQEEEVVVERRERNGDEEEWDDDNEEEEEEVVVESRDRDEDENEGDDDDKVLDGDQDGVQGGEQGGFESDDSLSEETSEDMEEAEDFTESGGNGSLWDRALAAAAGDDVKASSRLGKIGRLGQGAATSGSDAVKGAGAADEEENGLLRRDRKRKRQEEDEVDAEEDFGNKRVARDPRTSIGEHEEEPATTGEDRKAGSNDNLPVGGYFPGKDFTFTWRERVASGEDAGFSLNALLGTTSIPPATASPPVVEKGPSTGAAMASRTATADVRMEGVSRASEKNGGPAAVVQKPVTPPNRGKVGVKDGGDEAAAEKKGVVGKPGRKDEVEGGVEVVLPESEAEKPGVNAFMRSANAEEEWLATKAKLRTDYRRKKRQALRQGRLGQRGLV